MSEDIANSRVRKKKPWTSIPRPKQRHRLPVRPVSSKLSLYKLYETLPLTLKTGNLGRIATEVKSIKLEEKKVTRIKNKLEKYKEKLEIFDTNDLIDLFIKKSRDTGVSSVNADQIEYFMSRILENSVKGKVIDLTHMKVGAYFFSVLIPGILRKNRDIFQLNLKGNHLADAGLLRLLSFLLSAEAPQLCSLNLNSTELTEHGFRHLGQFLRVDETLTVLDVGNDEGTIRNKLGHASGDIFEEALASNSTLKFLKLRNLSLSRTILNGILRGLRTNRGLVGLDLGLNNSLGAGLGLSLKEHLFKSHLSELRLYKCGLGNKGLESLSHCLDSLYQCELKVLDLTENGINEKGLTSLFDRLTANKKLRELVLDRNPIKSRKISTLSNCLANNSQLQVLSMRECRLNNSICESFKNGLKKNRTLKVLRLAGNHIYSKGANLLFEALVFNKGLTLLDLSENKVSDKSEKELEMVLKNNGHLKTLSLKKNLIGDPGGAAVLRGVLASQSIRLVDLRNNIMLGSTLKKITQFFDKRNREEKNTMVQRFEKQIEELQDFLAEGPAVKLKLSETEQQLRKEQRTLAQLSREIEQKTLSETQKTSGLERDYLDLMNQRKNFEMKIFELEQKTNELEKRHTGELEQMRSRIAKRRKTISEREARVEEKRFKMTEDKADQERTLVKLRREIQNCEHHMREAAKEHKYLVELQSKEFSSTEVPLKSLELGETSALKRDGPNGSEDSMRLVSSDQRDKSLKKKDVSKEADAENEKRQLGNVD